MSQLAWVLEEYLEHVARGESPDIQEWLRRYPDLADELEPALAGLELLHRSDEPQSGQTLGEFHLVREIARGGMGVVYEAEQESLGRRVALKVLPFAAVLDERQLKRFRVESQSAAQLHHANIVPVYAVGRDRGVHYYAMQYIEGRSLAELTEDLRSGGASSAPLTSLTPDGSHKGPRYARNVARIAADAAAALDYAHGEGVVHRDVKPANLLVDAQSKIWITDFGLARGRAEQGLTATGDLIGTLRYMSPEQTRGQPADARSDVYSLGATLYEVLALEPAFAGDDAQRVLADIGTREPPSLRERNSAVPEELETIIVKAMAKEPTERYASAKELEEDLRRFLENRPILARRPALLTRAGKWASRHRALVASSILVLLLAVVGLAVATAIIAGKEREATASATVAARRLERAIEAVDAMLLETGARGLAGVPGMTKVRERLLEQALGFYETLVEDEGQRPELGRGQARVRRRMAEVLHLLGRSNEAIESAEVAESLLALMTDDPQLRRERAHVHDVLARIWLAEGKRTRSAASLALAKRLWQDVEWSVEVEDRLVSIRAREAWLAHMEGEEQRAISALREAIARQERIADRDPEYALNLASMLLTLGRIVGRTDDIDGAAELFEHARVALEATEGDQRYRLADLLFHYASALTLHARQEEALKQLGVARGLATGLVEEFPSVPEYRHRLAGIVAQSAMASAAVGNVDDAIEKLERAVREFAWLTERHESQPLYRYGWAATTQNLGFALRIRDGAAAAVPAIRASIELARPLAELASPPEASRERSVHRQVSAEVIAPADQGFPDFRAVYGKGLHYLSIYLLELGRWEAAHLTCREQVVRAAAEDAEVRIILAHALSMSPRSDGGEALAILERAGPVEERLRPFRHEARGMALYRAGRYTDSREALKQAQPRRLASLFLAMTNQALDEPSPWACYLGARVDAAKHDWDEGLDHIEREAASMGLRIVAD